MSVAVRVPTVSANEDTVTLVSWHKPAGTRVARGEIICTVETTKAAVDVEAEADGYLTPVIEAGKSVAVRSLIGVLTKTPDEDISTMVQEANGGKVGDERRWTKKAALVARRLGIDIEAVAARYPGQVIGEQEIYAAEKDSKGKRGDGAAAPAPAAKPASVATASTRPSLRQDAKPTPKSVLRPSPATVTGGGTDLYDTSVTDGRDERILLLGGGAGAGVITLDALSRIPNQRAVGILDNNPNTHGNMVRGVPVLGPIDRAEALFNEGVCDSVIILFTDNNDERASVFEDLRAKGVRFANIVDSSCSVRAGVSMGQGNLIMANGFFAAAVTIGDNNFFASHACVEHHSKVGSHCTFGPRLTTSGAVVIGDRVKMGMAVAIEPYLEIGESSLIPSGTVLTTDVPPHSVVKSHAMPTIRPR